MKQLTLAATGFEKHSKATHRAQFLAEMERVVPWSGLCELIEPVYSKGTTGRPPVGLERMLRIYFLQQWFNLSDPAVEESLYDSIAMRSFVGINLGREPAPDETTILRFRHLLESHNLQAAVRGGGAPDGAIDPLLPVALERTFADFAERAKSSRSILVRLMTVFVPSPSFVGVPACGWPPARNTTSD